MPDTLISLDEIAHLNIAAIDAEHASIVQHVNALHVAIRDGLAISALTDALGQLISLTEAHFTTEEALMREHEYPHYVSHKVEHERLIEHMVDLERQIRGGQSPLFAAIALDIKNWATIHIEISDRPLAKFLKAHGVS